MILFFYLARQYVRWFTICFSVFSALFLLIDLIELLRRAASNPNIGFSLVGKMLIYRFPTFFQDILPFTAFFASILCFWRLNKTSEITVLRAAGLSIWQMLTPIIGVVLFIGLLDGLLFNPVAAKFLERFYYLESIYLTFGKNAASTANENGLWLREANPQGGYKVIRAGHFDARQSIFSEVQVMDFSADEKFLSRSDGDIGRLEGGQLIIENGWHTSLQGYPHSFKVHTLKTGLTVDGIKESFINPKTLSIYQLRSYGNNLEKSGLSARKYFVYWHVLIAKIVWMIVLIKLASGFCLSHMRSGRTSSLIGIGVLIAFTLYFLKSVAYAMGLSGQLPIIVAAWLPTVITGLLSFMRLLYVEEG